MKAKIPAQVLQGRMFELRGTVYKADFEYSDDSRTLILTPLDGEGVLTFSPSEFKFSNWNHILVRINGDVYPCQEICYISPTSSPWNRLRYELHIRATGIEISDLADIVFAEGTKTYSSKTVIAIEGLRFQINHYLTSLSSVLTCKDPDTESLLKETLLKLRSSKAARRIQGTYEVIPKLLNLGVYILP